MYHKIWFLVLVLYFVSEARSLKFINGDLTDLSWMCRLPPSGSGPLGEVCAAYIPSYYYDPASRSCKRFIYGGCFGNANRFKTEEECMAMCKNVKI